MLPRQAGWLGLAALVSCNRTPQTPTALRSRPVTTLVTLQPGDPLPAPGPDRTPLGIAQKVPLESSLASIRNSKNILAFVDHAGGRSLIGQLVGEEGPIGAPFSIPAAHFLFAHETSDQVVTLVTAERIKGQQRLCMRSLDDKSRLSEPICFETSADILTALGDRMFLFDTRPPEPEETLQNPPRPKPKPKPPKKRKKPLTQKEAVKRLMASGKNVELWSAPIVRATGPSEASFTGLSFREAMAGVGLVGVEGRNERFDVLFYEHADPAGSEARAKIGVAQLDGLAKLDEPTRKSFGESKLEPAYLTDHTDLRLLSWADGAVALGHRGPKGKCDISVIGPFVMPMIPNAGDCGIDPQRFMPVARAARKNLPVDDEEPATIDGLRARRAFGQAAWDVGRSVYSTNHAWAFVGDDLFYWRNILSARKVDRPLVVERSSIHWGALALDGSGLAQTDEGMVVVDADRNVRFVKGVHARWLGGPDRADLGRTLRTPAVKIGEKWFQARGELAELYPATSPAIRPLCADTTAVVGGSKHGWVLELSQAALRVERLDEAGARTPMGTHSTELGPGFDAVQRARGGAIVVGPSSKDASKVVAYAMDGNGAISTARSIDLYGQDVMRSPFLRLVPLPLGGALLFDSERTRVVWLDDDGNPTESARLDDAPTFQCVDGRPAPAKIPGPTPGQLVAFEQAPGTCLTGEVMWNADGAFRWFGSTSDGIATRAELGVKKPGDIAARSVAPANAVFTAAGPLTPARCPSDMVLVQNALCVDRFEGTLADDTTGQYLSPDYPATPNLLGVALGEWATKRERQGDLFAKSLPLPSISAWQRSTPVSVVARAQRHIRPSGFVTGNTARTACEAAGKRLCKPEEWRKACRGEQDRMFPYGDAYEDLVCNVNNAVHAGALLHDNASVGHMDPRLDRVETSSGPLLRLTGSTPRCASRWGDDAIYDMVGNLDEWVDEKSGAFAGGFFSRGTTAGCEALITAHPMNYFDYSTGIRCCKSAL